MFVTMLLDSVVCSHASSALNKVWEEWTTEHGKSYDNQVGLSSSREQVPHINLHTVHVPLGRVCFCIFQTEILFRRAVWEKNLQLVVRHNREASAGKHSFTMGLNHLSDMVGTKPFVLSVLLMRSAASTMLNLSVKSERSVCFFF